MLTTELKEQIQTAYSTFLEARGFKARYCQRLMIAEVAKTLARDEEGDNEPNVCVVEAGTGTGKTVAYAIAAIPIAKALKKRLIISTATVALQEQIVFRDLPDVRDHSGLDFDWTLAKGRRRYLCLSRIDQALQQTSGMNQSFAFFEDEKFPDDEANAALYQRLVSDLGSGQWDGERDSWNEEIDDVAWSRVSTDHVQCTGRKCAFYENCVFYRARESVHKVDCIVTNHDLVLSDLLMGGGNVLPDPEECIFVFDEGHHLPDKTINHLSAFIALGGVEGWLSPVPGSILQMCDDVGSMGRFPHTLSDFEAEVQMFCTDLRMFGELMRPLAGEAEESETSLLYRFPQGLVPAEIRDAAATLAQAANRLLSALDGLKLALDEAVSDQIPGGNEEMERWLPVVSLWVSRLENTVSVMQAYAKKDNPDEPPGARWIEFRDEDIHLRASPIAVQDVLAEMLWSRVHAAAVTSATIAVGGDFSRFKAQSGVGNASFHTLPSPFHFQEQAVLSVPAFAEDPRERDDHTAMLIAQLPGLLEQDLGSLVLFTAWRQLFEVHDALSPEFQSRVLRQGAYSRTEIVRMHRERVDAGQPSVIFGVASFAEGIDLPGRYCDHVVIVKIPFSVPDDPVGATLSEWIESRGGNAFQEIMVPDAALRLVQSCGRLLRTETDRGRITILDKRLITQRYGQTLMDALPPFRREIGLR